MIRKLLSALLVAAMAVSCGNKSNDAGSGRIDPYEESETGKIIIPYTEEYGVKKVDVKLNGETFKMYWDTGASTSSISIYELGMLCKAGKVSAGDFIGLSPSQIADGSISVGMVFKIRELEILGNDGKSISISDVEVTVSDNENAPLLLGNDATEALGKKYTINPDEQVIEFEE